MKVNTLRYTPTAQSTKKSLGLGHLGLKKHEPVRFLTKGSQRIYNNTNMAPDTQLQDFRGKN